MYACVRACVGVILVVGASEWDMARPVACSRVWEGSGSGRTSRVYAPGAGGRAVEYVQALAGWGGNEYLSKECGV